VEILDPELKSMVDAAGPAGATSPVKTAPK
jgi:hypothetical protein